MRTELLNIEHAAMSFILKSDFFSPKVKGSHVLITGGTGSFGKAFMRLLLRSDVKRITILSRDEKKQYVMKSRFSDERLQYTIGDVRDLQAICAHMRGVDYVFHAAALKQVPSCEIFPYEAVGTNIIGTNNVLTAASLNEVRKVVCLSTDKAVYPVNAMGISKAMMEKVARARQWANSGMQVVITRYGNVLGSRGSLIPHWRQRLHNRQPLQITNPDMTRFIMSIEEAVQLVNHALDHGINGDIFVRKSFAASIDNLYRAFIEVYPDAKKVEPELVGTRLGEKLHETLISHEEWCHATDEGQYFRINEGENRFDPAQFFDRGRDSYMGAYSSCNSGQLTVEECISLIRGLEEDEYD